MPTVVDDRVVRLEFDNAQFERNVRRSMSTIDDLKRKLDFSNEAESFNELERSSRNLKFEELSDTLDSINKKFSLWGVVAKTTIENITTQALNSAKKVASALTIDPAKAGYSQYEQQIDNIATLMASIKDDAYYLKNEKGEIITDKNGNAIVDTTAKMQDLNNELEKLTWFVDETSGDQNAMLQGALAFVNSGSELEDSLEIMMGMTNWAFTLGQNANTAARVITQLGQAVSRGYIISQDWSSVETANMSNPKVTQRIIEQAAAMEKLVAIEQEDHTYKYYINKDIDEFTGELKKYKNGIEVTTGAAFDAENAIEVTAENFRTTLSEKWFTTDVLAAFSSQYGNFASELSKIVKKTNDKYGSDKGLLTTDWMDFVEAYTATAADDFEAREKIIADAVKEAGWEVEEGTKDMREYLELLSSPAYGFGETAMRKSQETRTLTAAVDATKKAVATAWSGIYTQIFGDAEKATELFSDIVEDLYDIFVQPVKDLQAAFKQWHDVGYKLLWGDEGAYQNLIASFQSFFGPDGIVMTAFQAIFGEVNASSIADVLLNLTQKFKDFTAALIPSEKTVERFTKIFEGFFALIDIGRHLIAGIKIALTPVVEFIGDILDMLFGATASGAGWIKTLHDMIVENQTFEKVGTAVANVLRSIFDVIRGIIDSLKNTGVLKTTDTLFKNLIDNFKGLFNSKDQKDTTAFLEFVNKSLDAIGNALKIVYRIGSKVADLIGNVLSDIDSKLSSESGTYLSVIWEFIKRITAEFVDRFVPSVDELRGILDDIHLDDILKMLKKFAIMFAVSAPIAGGIFLILKGLTAINELTWAVGNMLSPFMGFNATLSSLSAVLDALHERLQVQIVREIAAAALIFAGAIFVIVEAIKILANQLKTNRKATIDAARLLAGMAILLAGIMVVFSQIFTDRLNQKSLTKGIAAFAVLVLGVLALAWSLKKLAECPWGQILASALSLTFVLTVIGGGLALLSTMEEVKPTKMVGISLAISTMALGLIAIAASMKILASCPWDQLLVSAVVLSYMVAVLAGILAVLSIFKEEVNPGRMILTATALVILSSALVIIAAACMMLNLCDWDELWKGVLTISLLVVVLGGVGAALSALGAKSFIGAAVILLLAAAVFVMANALTALSLAVASLVSVVANADTGKLVANLAALTAGFAVLMATLVGAFKESFWKLVLAKIFGLDVFLLTVAAAIVVASVGVTKLAKAITKLEKPLLNLAEVFTPKYMLKLAGIFALIVVSMGLAVAIMSIFGTDGLIGALAFAVAVMSVGLALKYAAEGLAALASVGTDGIENISKAMEQVGIGLGLMLKEAVIGIRNTLPEIFGLIQDFLVDVALFIPDFFINLVENILDRIIEHTPSIMGKLKQIFDAFCNWLEESSASGQSAVGKLIKAVLGLINTMNENRKEIVKTLLNFVVNLIDSLADEITTNTDAIASAFDKMVGALLGVLVTVMQKAANHLGFDMFGDMKNGFQEAYWDKKGGVTQLASDFIQDLWAGIGDAIRNILYGDNYVMKAIDKALSAIGEWVQKKVSFQSTDGLGLADYVKRAFTEEYTKGLYAARGENEIIEAWEKTVSEPILKSSEYIPDKLKDITKAFLDAAEPSDEDKKRIIMAYYELGESMPKVLRDKLGIHSPSRVMAEISHYAVLGLVEGLSSSAYAVEEASDDIGTLMTTTLGRVYNTLSDEGSLDPVITPVLDLSQIQNGAGLINGMMSGYSIGASVENAGVASSGVNGRNAIASEAQVNNNSNSTVSNVNTFYITGDDPKQIAEEVSRILQRQVSRSEAKWAQ